MLGAIIGDIVGSRFEFKNHRSKDFNLFSDGCFATDDSIMTLAVAKAILETEKVVERGAGLYESDQKFYSLLSELTVNFMQEIGRKYPHCGFGGLFGQWIFSDNPQPYNSFGNGAAMRVSPVGFYARHAYEIENLSRAVTAVTHNHDEGLKGAEATARAVCLARTGSLKEEIRSAIERDYYQLDFTIDGIRDSYQFNETCQETVPQAIQAFLESTSFEDAIRTAISLGGDSDTIAAITGAIAEAYYGVPDWIKQQALSYLDNELLGIYREWEARAGVNDHGRFWTLTKYIGRFICSDPYGQWVVDDQGDGSLEKPFCFPWVNYSLPVVSFIEEANHFALSHPEFLPYSEVLDSHGIKWSHDDLCRVNADQMDGECLVALIVASVRAEKFCDGAVLRFLEEGCIQRWLKRLCDLDNSRRKERKLAELHLSIGGFGIPETVRLIFADDRSYCLSNEHAPMFAVYSAQETQRLRDAWDKLHTEYWRYHYPQEDDNLICDGTQWSLDVRYEDGFWIAYQGDNRYPEHWFGLLDLLGVDHDDGDEDDETGHTGSNQKPGEVIYCMVTFSKQGNAYAYRSDDESISAGDRVIVPVGEHNTERTGRVEAVNRYLPENVPYPLNKVKKIIRKASIQKHSQPKEQARMATNAGEFFCPVYEGMINQYDCDEISCGASLGFIPNDGLPLLMDIEVIKSRRDRCLNCEWRQPAGEEPENTDISMQEQLDNGERVSVSDIVDYRLWFDDQHTPIGVIVDFETADDFHYQLLMEDWKRFLDDVLGITDTVKATSAFCNYFKTNTGLFDFEEALVSHGIQYIKRAFYQM